MGFHTLLPQFVHTQEVLSIQLCLLCHYNSDTSRNPTSYSMATVFHVSGGGSEIIAFVNQFPVYACVD